MTPVLVIALGAGIYATLHWAKPEPEKKEEPPRPLSVFVETAEETDIALTVETSEKERVEITRLRDVIDKLSDY